MGVGGGRLIDGSMGRSMERLMIERHACLHRATDDPMTYVGVPPCEAEVVEVGGLEEGEPAHVHDGHRLLARPG